ncbi:MAG TPA: CAP domain-containing protein [Trichocoleus sp.]|jgi:uncharacterized protein YkwD
MQPFTTRLSDATSIAIRPKATIYQGKLDSAPIMYQFRLKQRSQFNLQLRGLAADADVEVLQDRNRNGMFDPGETIASSREAGTNRETIDLEGMTSGSYYLRILSSDQGTTNYSLLITAKPTSQTSLAYQVVQLTNAFRQQHGLPALGINTQLTRAAQTYAKQMALEDVFSHRGADGSSPWDRIRNAGYRYSDAAENLAAGHQTPESAVRGWIRSPGHRANLLAWQVQEIGIGYFFLAADPGRVKYHTYWAQSFGTPGEVDETSPGEAEPSDPFLGSIYGQLNK